VKKISYGLCTAEREKMGKWRGAVSARETMWTTRTYLVDLGDIGSADQFLELRHLVDACKGVDELGVQHALLHVLQARREEG
jgi:hypothetical protein